MLPSSILFTDYSLPLFTFLISSIVKIDAMTYDRKNIWLDDTLENDVPGIFALLSVHCDFTKNYIKENDIAKLGYF